MTRRSASDDRTFDLFAVPVPAPVTPGGMDYRLAVAELLKAILDESGFADRYEAAAAMSRLAGKEVTKYMLDAYTAPSREDYNAPAWLMPVAETACRSHRYTAWCAELRGGRLYLGAEALKAEIGRMEHQRDELAKLIRDVKRRLGEES